MVTIKFIFEDGSEDRQIEIDRARDPRLNSRLSCQCDLMEDETFIEVIVPDQSTIIAS